MTLPKPAKSRKYFLHNHINGSLEHINIFLKLTFSSLVHELRM